MMTVLFLHGFFASGNCVPALTIKAALNGEARVLTPDLPLHPNEALDMIRRLCKDERIDVLVGNSCGSFYAQQIAAELGLPVLLGNPYFMMTEFLIPRIGPHQYKSVRTNGVQDFVIDDQLVQEFAELEIKQFEKHNPNAVWGLFGEQDQLAHFEPMFREHYNTVYHFSGAHTPTAEETEKYYVPLIRMMMKSDK